MDLRWFSICQIPEFSMTTGAFYWRISYWYLCNRLRVCLLLYLRIHCRIFSERCTICSLWNNSSPAQSDARIYCSVGPGVTALFRKYELAFTLWPLLFARSNLAYERPVHKTKCFTLWHSQTLHATLSQQEAELFAHTCDCTAECSCMR